MDRQNDAASCSHIFQPIIGAEIFHQSFVGKYPVYGQKHKQSLASAFLRIIIQNNVDGIFFILKLNVVLSWAWYCSAPACLSHFSRDWAEILHDDSLGGKDKV